MVLPDPAMIGTPRCPFHLRHKCLWPRHRTSIRPVTVFINAVRLAPYAYQQLLLGAPQQGGIGRDPNEQEAVEPQHIDIERMEDDPKSRDHQGELRMQ